MDKMREEFEKWIKPLGHFWLVNEAIYWEVWQAAHKSAVPDGYCVVPVDPTREMWAASGDAVVKINGIGVHHDIVSRVVFDSMISAAPKR